MAISNRLKQFLGEAGVHYTVVKHPVVYTAQEIAAAQHVPGRQLAKCVLVLTNRGPVLSVLSAIHRVDLPKLKRLLQATKLSIARETDIKKQFPDVDVGAMSPFGQLYDVPVVVDQTLSTMNEIVFNAGSHTETVTMRYGEFAKLVRPRVGTFAQAIVSPVKAKRTATKKPAKRKGSTRRRTGSRTKTRRRSRR